MGGARHQHSLLQLAALQTVVHPTADERDKGGVEDIVGFGALASLRGKGEGQQNLAGLKETKYTKYLAWSRAVVSKSMQVQFIKPRGFGVLNKYSETCSH